MGIERTPARDTRPATSRRRRTWYGFGSQARVEKHPAACVLHDAAYVFGDVSFASLPVLFVIFLSQDPGAFGVVTTGMIAWATLVATAVAIRGGWIRPFGTDTLGWVSLKLTLVALRLVYYNVALGLAVFGGLAVAEALGLPVASFVVAATVSGFAALAFPRIAESLYHRFVY